MESVHSFYNAHLTTPEKDPLLILRTQKIELLLPTKYFIYSLHFVFIMGKCTADNCQISEISFYRNTQYEENNVLRSNETVNIYQRDRRWVWD